MRELFIYWRVAAAQAEQAVAAAAAVQTALTKQHAGLLARLYRRADTDDRITLMESYALAGDGIDAGLQATLVASTASALQVWCDGQRHVEAFDVVAGQ